MNSSIHQLTPTFARGDQVRIQRRGTGQFIKFGADGTALVLLAGVYSIFNCDLLAPLPAVRLDHDGGAPCDVG